MSVECVHIWKRNRSLIDMESCDNCGAVRHVSVGIAERKKAREDRMAEEELRLQKFIEASTTPLITRAAEMQMVRLLTRMASDISVIKVAMLVIVFLAGYWTVVQL